MGVVGTQRDTTDLVLRQSGIDPDTQVSFGFDFGKGGLGRAIRHETARDFVLRLDHIQQRCAFLDTQFILGLE